MSREHPFDRYAPFTDVAALKEWSEKPLRKSVRVNTLKCSVGRFQEWAKEKGWQLESVPWCREGFFIDREERKEALGKDLLHLIGGFYIQEAASMLPVELLDPQPEEAVLDMSAAPGSKTTQIASRMQNAALKMQNSQEITGVIVANDIQEHRLWTLKSALYRSGVTNAIVTKKVGQWFTKHMTERFDRVLCDAPCTAQGTVRKDSDALSYCGLENIEKMARLQVQLLEAAIHAAKVGGRIVYSTCTLTPEENEGVVGAILEKFGGKVEIVDPRNAKCPPAGRAGRMQNAELFDQCVLDSQRVQKFLQSNSQFSILPFEGLSPSGPNGNSQLPFLRLWPQTYDTEGFFCAVLEKRAPTREVEQMEWIPFQEERLPGARQKEIATKLEDCYGTSFLADTEVLLRSGEQLFLTNEEVAEFPLPVKDYSVGIPFAKLLNDGRIRLSHEIALFRGTGATRARCFIDDHQLALFLDGKDAPGDPELHGDVLLLYQDFCIGRALAKKGLPAEASAKVGMLKNNLPRWMVRD